MTTYPSKTYAFKKADILRIFRDIDPNFSLDLPSITESKAEPQQNNDLPNFLYLKPLLSIDEAACIISNDNPYHESAARNHMSDDDYFNKFQGYIEARDFVDSAIEAEELQYINYKIKKSDFALFLRTHNIIRQGFNDNLSPEPINNFGTPTIASAPSLDNHYRQLSEKQQADITQLKAYIAELENEKMQSLNKQNEILDNDIAIKNSDLLLISVLMQMLRNEIIVKANKSQERILQKIEDENSDIKGLSTSRTKKIIADANRLYNSLKNNQMK